MPGTTAEGAADIVIRPVATADLPTLLALYQHLNAEDPMLEIQLAVRRFADILAHPA